MLVFLCILLSVVTFTFTHEIVFDRIEAAFGDKDEILAFDGLRVKKFNRTLYVLDGKYTLKKPIDDSYSVVMNAYNWQGGQYKKLGDKRVDKLCETLYDGNKYEAYYNDFQAVSNKPIPFGTCPYPAGTYEITNYMIEDKGDLPAYVPGGEKWRIDIRVYLGEKELGGYNFYGLLRNEKNILAG